MSAHATYDPRHPHEPEIPPSIAPDGHCRVCRLTVERDEARQQLRPFVQAFNDVNRERCPRFRGRLDLEAFNAAAALLDRVAADASPRIEAPSQTAEEAHGAGGICGRHGIYDGFRCPGCAPRTDQTKEDS